MTAIPVRPVVGEAVAALVVPGRARPAQLGHLQQAAKASGFTGCAVIRGKGRRSGGGEELVSELVVRNVSVVVVASLSALHPDPVRALGLLGVLLNAGLRVVSLAEAWTTTVDTQSISAIATFLASAEARRSSRRSKSVIAAVRATGGRIGRPPVKPIDIIEARRLREQGFSYREAGRALGASASSVRRALLLPNPVPQGETP